MSTEGVSHARNTSRVDCTFCSSLFYRLVLNPCLSFLCFMWLHFEGKSHDFLLKNTHVLEQEKGPEDARREGRCFIMCTLAWWGKLDKGPQEGPHMPVLVQVSLRGSIALALNQG